MSPFIDTILIFPFFSVTSNLPSGRETIPHGEVSRSVMSDSFGAKEVRIPGARV